MDFLFEPVRFDSSGGRLVLPTRLRNRGTEALVAPVRVTVKRLVDQSATESATVEEADSRDRPRLLGVVEGDAGDGSVLDLSSALGTSGRLPGGAVSEAVEIVVLVNSPAPAMMLEVDIEAGVEQAKKKPAP